MRTAPCKRAGNVPGDGLVDGTRVLYAFVVRRNSPNLDDCELTPPLQTSTNGLDSQVWVGLIGPVRCNEEHSAVHDDGTLVQPARVYLRERLLDLHLRLRIA